MRRWLTQTVRYLMIRQMWNSRREQILAVPKALCFHDLYCAENIELNPLQRAINLIFAQFTGRTVASHPRRRRWTRQHRQATSWQPLNTKSIINTLCTWYELWYGWVCDLITTVEWLNLWSEFKQQAGRPSTPKRIIQKHPELLVSKPKCLAQQYDWVSMAVDG